MMDHDIFISYKTEDYDAASRIRSELELNGLRCWMAPENIPGGSSYAKEIPAAIRQCRVLVAVLSRKTMSSIWVSRELDQAVNEEKKIMPFMLEDFRPEGDYGFYLTAVQFYPGFKNRDEALRNMIGDIRAFLALPAEPVVISPDPSWKKYLLWGITAVLLLVLAFVVTKAFLDRPAPSEPVIPEPVFSETEPGTGPVPFSDSQPEENPYGVIDPVKPGEAGSGAQPDPDVPIPLSSGD